MQSAPNNDLCFYYTHTNHIYQIGILRTDAATSGFQLYEKTEFELGSCR